ncbi:tyrosine decarboxylase [Salix suchowensis]|nr:tyrosine decarboxylase [Salix suchowensis]
MGSLSTNTFSSLDLDGFTNDSKMVIDFIAEYYKNIENYPVQSQVKPGYLLNKLPDTAPYCPESLEDVIKDVTDSIIPGLTHWQSPNFFAYFQANASTAGFVGEMLCTGLNVVGFNWISSPAATELESIVMDWIGKMLKLPSTFLFSGNGGGVLHGSTCEAIVCTLAAARDRTLRNIGAENIAKLSALQHVELLIQLWIWVKLPGNIIYGSTLMQLTQAQAQRCMQSLGIEPLKHKDACKATELNRKLLAAVNESGRAFMTHSVVGGLFIIRCAVGSTLIEERHVDDLWKLIQEKAADLVEEIGAIGE